MPPSRRSSRPGAGSRNASRDARCPALRFARRSPRATVAFCAGVGSVRTCATAHRARHSPPRSVLANPICAPSCRFSRPAPRQRCCCARCTRPWATPAAEAPPRRARPARRSASRSPPRGLRPRQCSRRRRSAWAGWRRWCGWRRIPFGCSRHRTGTRCTSGPPCTSDRSGTPARARIRHHARVDPARARFRAAPTPGPRASTFALPRGMVTVAGRGGIGRASARTGSSLTGGTIPPVAVGTGAGRWRVKVPARYRATATARFEGYAGGRGHHHALQSDARGQGRHDEAGGDRGAGGGRAQVAEPASRFSPGGNHRGRNK